MNTSRWLRWEEKAVVESDAVVTVVDEMRDAVITKYPTAIGKVTVVMNAEPLVFSKNVAEVDIYTNQKEKFIVAYVGGLGPHRGIDVVINGMTYINSDKIVLMVIGGGSQDAIQELLHQVDQLNLRDRVKFLGHQPFSKVFSFMKMADVNLIPHKRNAQNDNGVPHKLFQSMMVGKPVLVSSCKPLKRIVETTRSGLAFESENPVDFANKLQELYSNSQLRETLGENGYRYSVTGSFSWQFSASQLTDLYDKLSTS